MTEHDASSQLSNPTISVTSGSSIAITFRISSTLSSALNNAKMIFARFNALLGGDNADFLLGVHGVYLKVGDTEYGDNTGFRTSSYGITEGGVATTFQHAGTVLEFYFSAGTTSIANQLVMMDRDSWDLVYWD